MKEFICDLPWDDRPRERMLKHGPSSLSNAELLALVMGCGNKELNVLQLSRKLIKRGILNLGRTPIPKLMEIPGIGPATAMKIAAMYEFSLRMREEVGNTPEPPPYEMTAFGTSLVATHSGYEQEHVGAVFLDTHHRIRDQRDLHVGTIDQVTVSLRDILQIAFDCRAVSLVLFHNHPSGSTVPSQFDIDFTVKLRDSLAMLDLKLVDHLIVGGNSFLSMKMRNLM